MSSSEREGNHQMDQDLQERRGAMDELETMMGELEEEETDTEGIDDPRVDWLMNAESGNRDAMHDGLWVDEGEEGEDDDDDDFYDEDYIDEDDDDIYVEGDELEEEEEEGEDGEVIDLQTIFRAATQGTTVGADGEDASRTARALNGIGLEGLRRLLSTGRLQIRTVGEDDDEEEEDDSTLYYGGGSRRGPTKMSEFWEPVKEPVRAGRELLDGGEFGRPASRPASAPKSCFAPSRNLVDTISNRRNALRRVDKHELANYIPNTNGTEVARYPTRSYCGQYSEDSSFFYTCTQDFRVHMYDTTANPYKQVHRYEDTPRYSRSMYYASASTTHLTSLKSIKTIQGRQGSWTITDANLSPDNQWMIYSSITPYVYLVPTRQEVESGGRSQSDNQVMLDFSNQGSDDAGIWSIRFSGDSREIVAGAHFGDIYVYDIEARRRVLKVEGHTDDVNGVAFADSASSHVLISGSDDSFVKIWDRRSLSSGKPAGVLPGHTEGITFVAPKGDGRYCISNGKDQSTKLWDLRKLVSSSDFDRSEKLDYGNKNFDYRNMTYSKPRYNSHPDDCSVMTYRGHAVLRTLIRCHFSPLATTGQQYIYSGSADGRIHIWSLDGRIVQVLDRSKVVALCQPGSTQASDPSGAIETTSADATGTSASRERSDAGATRHNRSYMWNQRATEACTVRDVSWHSSEPSIMSTAWDGPDGQHGSIAKHEWKGYGKNGLSLEDAIEKSIAEAAR